MAKSGEARPQQAHGELESRTIRSKGARTTRSKGSLSAAPAHPPASHAFSGYEFGCLSNGARVAEFFAGIGLVRLACERQGLQVVFANDLDPKKRHFYVNNFGDSHFTLGDVHLLSPEDVPVAELYTASFPCNDLSVAGSMAGIRGKESGAFWGLIHLLEAKRVSGQLPQCVLLENVPGFLLSKQGQDLESALLALNQLGYAVDLMIVDAARFTPQSRARLFVAARLRVTAQPQEVSGYPFGLGVCDARPASLVRFILSRPHVDWSIVPLPPLPQRTLSLTDILEDLPHNDPAWWNDERTNYLLTQLSPSHAAIAQRMMGGETPTYATAFRRVRKGRSMAELRTDGLAGCLRTPRGGSGRQILFKAGGGKCQVRLLSARECARLQGVPETFQIQAPLNQALFGFGDAVCVPVVEWVLKHALGVNFLDRIS